MAGSEIKIRRMTNADLKMVNEIDQQLSGDRRASSWPFSFEAYWDIYGPGVSFVAEVGSKVVGFLGGTITQQERSYSIIDLMHSTSRHQYPKVGWIDLIGILPGYQERDIGRALVNAFNEECKLQGAPMRAIVKEGDSQVSGFLSKLGFNKSETTCYEFG